MRSLKLRFRLIIYMFMAFVFVLMGELFYFNFLENRQDKHISKSYDLLAEFVEYSKAEKRFRSMLMSYGRGELDWKQQGVDDVSEGLVKLRSSRAEFLKNLRVWRADTAGVDDALEAEFDELSQRHFKAYDQAFSLLKEGKLDELKFLLKIEAEFAENEPVMVLKILEGSREQSQYYQKMFGWFFTFSLMFLIPAFALVVMVSTGILRSFVRDINLLVKVAGEIREGEVKKRNVRAKLKETARLVEAFEEMQLEIHNRDRLLQIESDKVRDFNKELEAKVDERNVEIKRQNDLLERKNEELEQILYAASHDLRTPLIGIQGFSQELQYLCETLQSEIAELDLDEDVAERLNVMIAGEVPDALKFIMSGSSKMESMIQGLLRVSRLGLQDLELKPVEMTKVFTAINDQLSFQAQTAGAMILSENLMPCMGDAEQLEQVFLNLISNAIKYRSEERSCEVTMSAELSEDGREVIYKVKDNGLGISEDQQKSVFKTFYRVDPDKVEGEGLGLTIAVRIIDKHGGKLWLESVEGEGSTFFVSLPTVDKAEEV